MNTDKQHKTKSIKDITNKFLGLSEVNSFEPFRLETDGKTYINVFGKCELSECSETKALFGIKDIKAEIDGFDFELSLYSDSQLIISGKPDKISFFG